MRIPPRLIVLCFFISPALFAQKDSLRLICPLDNATVVPPPKNQMQLDESDYCIVLVSIPDTIVKACTSGRITNVSPSPDDDGKWDVVMFRRFNNKDYYFWYVGIDRSIVKRLENVKEGQAIGHVKSGNKIELLMFDFETPVDPLKHMTCEKVLERN